MTERQWLSCDDPAALLDFAKARTSDRKLRLFACACVRCLGHLLADEASRRAVDTAERYADGLADDTERAQVADAAGAVVSRAGEAAQARRQATAQARRASYGVEGPAKTRARAAWVDEATRWHEIRARACAAEAAHDLLRRLTAMESQWPEHLTGPPYALKEERTVPLHAVGRVEQALRHSVEAGAVRTNWETAALTPSFGGCREDRWGAARRAWTGECCALLRCVFGNPFRPVPAIDLGWLEWRRGLVMSMTRRMYEDRDFADMGVLADALEEACCEDMHVLDHCRGWLRHARGCWVVDALLHREPEKA
jgi:hypothetical protein